MDDRMREELAAIDRQLEEVRIPPELEQRILHPAHHETSRWPMVLVGLAIVVLVSAAWWLGRSTRRVPVVEDSGSVASATPEPKPQPAPVVVPPPPSPAPAVAEPEQRWDGALALASGCETTGDRELEAQPGCRLSLADPRLEIEVFDAAKMRPAERGFRVDEGLVLVSVETIAAGEAPVRVEVTGGTIEVTGTRFLVVQSAEARYVHLLEGAISFVPSEGPRVQATIGVPLHWGPTPPPWGTAYTTTPRAPSNPTAQPPSLDQVLDEVAALRRRQHYREAVSVLRRARGQVDDPAVQEVLSFEEGTLREHYRPAASVCTYWRGHLTRFFAGRDAAPIERRLERLDCPPPRPSDAP